MFIFQYISCYGLSRFLHRLRSSFRNFNTSHVTVYPTSPAKYPAIKLFQYISCYGLSCFNPPPVSSRRISIHLMLRFIVVSGAIPQIQGYFNTSHVTVYHYKDLYMDCLEKFQYISCYGLS